MDRFAQGYPPATGESPVLAYADHAVVALHHCGGCPNSGVPITEIIADLGILLPRNSTRKTAAAGLPVDRAEAEKLKINPNAR